MTGRVSKLLFSKLYKPLPHLLPESMNDLSTICLLHHFSTTRIRPMMGETRNDSSSEDVFLQNYDNHEEEFVNEKRQLPPNPIPNRPLRGGKRMDSFKLGNDEEDERVKPSQRSLRAQFENRSMRGEKGEDRSRKVPFGNKFELDSDNNEKMKKSYLNPSVQFPNSSKPISGGNADDQSVASYLEKFHLGDEKKDNPFRSASAQVPEAPAEMSLESPPEDADEIFKKMKETGLIPNAVAMLDGLCKDGLVQEAMKLFGLMREKGTIPEVVIYTAVVEGFCKAQKLEDAKRIFRKMQNNGISPNAFSYTVLIQGLSKAKRLDDAIGFCVEMLEAGHSPNLLTFVSLVDGYCTKEGVEEAEQVIGRLKEKGFFVNEKAVREHLDKKGPFSPLLWEAIFGKKSSQRPF